MSVARMNLIAFGLLLAVFGPSPANAKDKKQRLAPISVCSYAKSEDDV
jgi:hypothetical protein